MESSESSMEPVTKRSNNVRRRPGPGTGRTPYPLVPPLAPPATLQEHLAVAEGDAPDVGLDLDGKGTLNQKDLRLMSHKVLSNTPKVGSVVNGLAAGFRLPLVAAGKSRGLLFPPFPSEAQSCVRGVYR